MSFFNTVFGPPDMKTLRQKEDIKGLIRALGYPRDANIRLEAARMLGDLKEGKAVKPLIQALKDTDPRVIRAAITSLGQIGDEEGLAPLKSIVEIEKKKEKPDTMLIGSLYDSIKRVGGIEYLIESANDPDGNFRFFSLQGLIDIQDPRLFQLFVDQFNEKSWLSRSYAVDGLVNSGDARAIPYLVAGLRQEREIRSKAAYGLLRFGVKDILIQNLQDKAGDKDGEFRLEIVDSLSGSRDMDCITAVLALLKEHNTRVSIRIVRAIRLDDRNRLIDILEEILLDRENSNEVHQAAAEELGKIDDGRAADILFATFEYYPLDSSIEWVTIQSYKRRKDPRLVEALIRFLEDAEVRMVGLNAGRLSALRFQLQGIENQMQGISSQIYSKLPAIKLEEGEYLEDKMERLGMKPSEEVLSLQSTLAPLAVEKFRIEQEISRLRIKKDLVFPRYGAEETALQFLQSLTHQGFTRSKDWRRWKES
jgi:HEAT repeat protein